MIQDAGVGERQFWVEECLKAFIINNILSFNRNMQSKSAVQYKRQSAFGSNFPSKEYETNSTCLDSILLDGPSPNTSKQSPHQSQNSGNEEVQHVYLRHSFPTEPDLPSTKSTKKPSAKNNIGRYQQMERILKSENLNLKQQNNLLLQEVNRLRGNNKRYRDIDRLQRIQIQQLNEQREVQRRRADQLKEMIMTRMSQLEEKVMENCPTDRTSFLEILEFSQDLTL